MTPFFQFSGFILYFSLESQDWWVWNSLIVTSFSDLFLLLLILFGVFRGYGVDIHKAFEQSREKMISRYWEFRSIFRGITLISTQISACIFCRAVFHKPRLYSDRLSAEFIYHTTEFPTCNRSCISLNRDIVCSILINCITFSNCETYMTMFGSSFFCSVYFISSNGEGAPRNLKQCSDVSQQYFCSEGKQTQIQQTKKIDSRV